MELLAQLLLLAEVVTGERFLVLLTDKAAHYTDGARCVQNVDDWYQHVLDSGVVQKFASRIEPPADQPWRLRDFPMTDPSGVLWRVGQNIP